MTEVEKKLELFILNTNPMQWKNGQYKEKGVKFEISGGGQEGYYFEVSIREQVEISEYEPRYIKTQALYSSELKTFAFAVHDAQLEIKKMDEQNERQRQLEEAATKLGIL